MMLTILSSIFLKETIGWRRYTACAVGFFGAMLIIQPSFQEVGFIALLPVVTALCIAVYVMITRVVSHSEDAGSMQFQAGLWGTGFSLILLALGRITGSAILDPVKYLRTTVVNGSRTWGRRRRLELLHRTSRVEPAAMIADEMWDALAALTPRRRAAIVLRFYEDLPDGEIAALLGCRPATVRTIIHRALIDLRKELGNAG